MKTKHIIIASVAAVTAFIAGIFIGKGRADPTSGTVNETRETFIDTIPYFAPMPKSELGVGTLRYTLPTYRFLGTGAGGEPRQCLESCPINDDMDSVTAKYGAGAGGEPRCSTDSAIVELPMIQRHYADSTYEAWVSGPVDPRLDSVRVFSPTTIVTRQVWKPPKRWHIGVTAGYGYGPKGFQPYIGVGVTYSIFSF